MTPAKQAEILALVRKALADPTVRVIRLPTFNSGDNRLTITILTGTAQRRAANAGGGAVAGEPQRPNQA